MSDKIVQRNARELAARSIKSLGPFAATWHCLQNVTKMRSIGCPRHARAFFIGALWAYHDAPSDRLTEAYLFTEFFEIDLMFDSPQTELWLAVQTQREIISEDEIRLIQNDIKAGIYPLRRFQLLKPSKSRPTPFQLLAAIQKITNHE
jgi:hypothetical protein